MMHYNRDLSLIDTVVMCAGNAEADVWHLLEPGLYLSLRKEVGAMGSMIRPVQTSDMVRPV